MTEIGMMLERETMEYDYGASEDNIAYCFSLRFDDV